MSTPTFDLSKVQYTSMANSFKNDGVPYKGTLTLSASIPSGSFLTASTSVTLTNQPQFAMLYAYYQEATDMQQQYAVGSGYQPAQWYQATVNNKIGVHVTSAPNVGVITGIIYPVINNNQVTVTAIINNPYSNAITYDPLTIPWAFFCYTLSN